MTKNFCLKKMYKLEILLFKMIPKIYSSFHINKQVIKKKSAKQSCIDEIPIFCLFLKIILKRIKKLYISGKKVISLQKYCSRYAYFLIFIDF